MDFTVLGVARQNVLGESRHEPWPPSERTTKTTRFGLVIGGLAGLSGGSLRLIMNSLGKKDGKISGNQYATGVA
jgi:hypothetical protein